MPLSCNVNVNLNNLRGSLESNLSTLLSLNLGTPAGLAAVAATVATAFDDIGAGIVSAIDEVVPDISIRDELDTLSKLAETPLAAAEKAASLVGDFAEATGLDGFVNLDLTDLSNSTFNTNIAFDPCNPSVPNLFRRADGTTFSKPSIGPNLGSDKLAVSNITKQPITDNIQSVVRGNSFISSALPPTTGSINPSVFLQTQQGIIQQNITPSRSGMGNTLIKSSSGEQKIETRDSFISRVKGNTAVLTEV